MPVTVPRIACLPHFESCLHCGQIANIAITSCVIILLFAFLFFDLVVYFVPMSLSTKFHLKERNGGDEMLLAMNNPRLMLGRVSR